MKSFHILLLLVAVYQPVTAQTPDTLRTEATTEDARISAAEVKRFIRYITRADVEERTLFKVGIWPATTRTDSRELAKLRFGLNLEVSLEQKISPSLSFLLGMDAFWLYQDYKRLPVWPGPKPPNAISYNQLLKLRRFDTNAKLGLRYYYAQARQIRAGKTANNFSGNYILAQSNVPWYATLRNDVADVYSDEESTVKFKDRQLNTQRTRFLLAYGLQRRLGQYAYFDINAGPEMLLQNSNRIPTFSFQLNALVGFGW
jgi:hypothetical protein